MTATRRIARMILMVGLTLAGCGDDGAPTDDGSSTSTTTGEGSTGEPPGECVEASDCFLVSTCCDCLTLPGGTFPPPCDQNCGVPLCENWGVTEVSCDDSVAEPVCQLTPLQCDPATVTCGTERPMCGPDRAPTIEDGCWTGNCSPQMLCDVIPGA